MMQVVDRPHGWTIGNGVLPHPKDEPLLWRIASDIIASRKGGVLVLTHHNADIDAVASSLVLKKAFPWVKLGAYKSISSAGRKLLDELKADMTIDPVLKDFALIIVMDSSSTLQVSEGDVSDWPKHWIVDHHQDTEHWGDRVYSDPERGACVEIALQMAFLTGARLDREMALCAIAGIVADTGKFRFARPMDLTICSFILGANLITMEEVLSVIEGEEYFDVSKKVAQLKALRRVQFEKVGEQIVATSRVSSFEAAAARALLVAGADVVFIAADRKDELRISSRAKPHILAMGVHLGSFMEEIGKMTGNQGGGHDGAAGLNGQGNADKVLSLCMKRMSQFLADRMFGPGKRVEEGAPPKEEALDRSHSEIT